MNKIKLPESFQNLSLDKLIALVDLFVYQNKDKIIYPLSFDFRKQLINLLNKEVIINKKKYTIDYSISLVIKSYINCFNTGEIKLDLPLIIYE